MGKEEHRKVKRNGPEGGRKREAWKKVGLGEDARLLGRLGSAARRRKEEPGKGNGPKGRRWVCPTLALL